MMLVWLTVITTFIGGFKDLAGYCRHPDCTELSGMFCRHFQLLWNPTDTDRDRSNSFPSAGYWGGQHFHSSPDTSGMYSFIQTLLNMPVIFDNLLTWSRKSLFQCSAQSEQLWTLITSQDQWSWIKARLFLHSPTPTNKPSAFSYCWCIASPFNIVSGPLLMMYKLIFITSFSGSCRTSLLFWSLVILVYCEQ